MFRLDTKDVIVLTGAAIAGNYFAEMFLLRAPDGSGPGFFDVNDGLGMDDLARGLSIAIMASLIGKVV